MHIMAKIDAVCTVICKYGTIRPMEYKKKQWFIYLSKLIARMVSIDPRETQFSRYGTNLPKNKNSTSEIAR